MACLEMYNSNGGSPMSPRISFSNDFVEIKPERQNKMRSPLSRTEGSNPVLSSSDFEFSVTNYSMMTADELFFKGKLLPFKETTHHVQRTLREELLIEEEDPDDDCDNDDNFTLRTNPPSSSSSSSKRRWKGLLGRKRAHVGSKKADKMNAETFVHQDTLVNTNPAPEVLGEEGSNRMDMENGI